MLPPVVDKMTSKMVRSLMTVLVALPLLTVALVFKITKLECQSNENYITNMSCQLKPINWQNSICNFEADIVKPINDLSLNVALFARNDANFYKPFLINSTFNLCDAFAKRGSVIYSKIAVRYFKKFSNINHSCPFEGHLKSTNVNVDEKMLPVLPPNGLYKFVLRFFNQKPQAEIATFSAYLTVEDEVRKPRRRT